ncbi:MAG: lipopolysaccharide heptosyltransferase II [Pseudomonadota bacterium]|nr:lipopolysaccharide heptosyltransferase II [Pseudomonadota bacterium]
MKTLVISPNWIGDAVMAQPLIALIKRFDPNGTIDAAAPGPVAPIMRAMPEINEVLFANNVHHRLQLSQRWRLSRELRARGYDRCYILPNSLKSLLAPWLAGIPQRIGHRGEARTLFLTHVHEDDRAKTQPMVEFYAALAFEPRYPLPGRVPDPVLMRRPEAEHRVREKYGIRTDEPLVILCPGSEYGPAKRWPARHFASLAGMVATEWPGATVLLLGSPKERSLGTEIAALSGQAVRNLSGETSLDEALALISQAQGVVSNDSGLMHVAAAYGRPLVAVFGSSDPRHTPPRSPRARIEWLHLECSPCFERNCPLGHTNCLNDIEPSRVLDSLRRAMRFETAPRPPQ